MDDRKKSAGTVCILPHLTGVGGPISFQARIKRGLEERNFKVIFNPRDPQVEVILVVGGPARFVGDLLRARQRGVRIVQRLNGMNWMHSKRLTPPLYYLRCEWNNWILSMIRRHIAQRIVYQSGFTRHWWEDVYGSVKVPTSVVYNGVNLILYSPEGQDLPPTDHFRILLVEGHLGGGYEQGLAHAVQLVQMLGKQIDSRIELVVVGDVSGNLRKYWDENSKIWISWSGMVPAENIPSIDRSSHLLFSTDINAACPNSVVEALACGLPVIGFATGALPEMVIGNSGRVVPYGSDYWQLEPPVLSWLVEAARIILNEQAEYRLGARKQAEAEFGLDKMVEGYLKALF